MKSLTVSFCSNDLRGCDTGRFDACHISDIEMEQTHGKPPTIVYPEHDRVLMVGGRMFEAWDVKTSPATWCWEQVQMNSKEALRLGIFLRSKGFEVVSSPLDGPDGSLCTKILGQVAP